MPQMREFRDRAPGLAGRRVALYLLAALVAGAVVVLTIDFDRHRGLATIALVVPVALLVYGAVIPWLRWGRSDLVVDAHGIHFGARGRSLPTAYRGPGDATCYPLFVPWSAVRQASVVGPEQTADLVAAARAGVGRGGQVSRLWGFFPSAAASHHLVMTVDSSAVQYPPDSTGLQMGAVNLVPSTAWALPVRDAAGLRRAFSSAQVPLTDDVGGGSALTDDA